MNTHWRGWSWLTSAVGRAVAVHPPGEECLHPFRLAADVWDLGQLNDPLAGQTLLGVAVGQVDRDVIGEPAVVMTERCDGRTFPRPLRPDHDRHLIVLAARLHDPGNGADHEAGRDVFEICDVPIAFLLPVKARHLSIEVGTPRRLRRSWRGRGQQDAAVTRCLKLPTGRLQWSYTRNLYNDAKKT